MKLSNLHLIGLVVLSCLSTTSYADDLLGLFTASLKSDPQLLAEQASRHAVLELKEQTKANFLPQVGLTANKGHIWQDIASSSFVGGSRDYGDHGYALSITQSVYRHQNYVQRAQSDIAIESAQASYNTVEQALIIRVAEHYFEVLGQQDNVEFAHAELKSIAEQLEQTTQRFDVGLATITDVVESQAAYDFANASLIAAENDLANSHERLREISGYYPELLSSLKSESPLVSPEPADSEQWRKIALAQNPSLAVAQANVDNAEKGIELQKSGHYPSVNLVGQKNYSSQSDSSFGGSSKTHQESLSLQLTIPIYSGGSVQSKTREAGFRLDQAIQNQEQQRRAVIRQSREAYNGVISGISRVKALKQAVVSGEKALESTVVGYEVGTRTTVEVLNIRTALFKARRNYASSRYAYILSSLRLKQAAGTVSIDDLDLINQWLEL